MILTPSGGHAFVRKAASLNVSGYLLKSELNPRDLAARIGSGVGKVVAVPPHERAQSLNLKVLFVHSPTADHRDILRLLADWGCTIMPTDDLEEAEALLREGGLDISLIEDELDPSGGFSVSKRLRDTSDQAGGKRSSFVLVSEKALDEIKEAGERSGIDTYIAKPVDEQSLLNTLKDLSTLASGDTATLFDRAELMERAGDEVELVLRMLELFYRDAPGSCNRPDRPSPIRTV